MQNNMLKIQLDILRSHGQVDIEFLDYMLNRYQGKELIEKLFEYEEELNRRELDDMDRELDRRYGTSKLDDSMLDNIDWEVAEKKYPAIAKFNREWEREKAAKEEKLSKWVTGEGKRDLYEDPDYYMPILKGDK